MAKDNVPLIIPDQQNFFWNTVLSKLPRNPVLTRGKVISVAILGSVLIFLMIINMESSVVVLTTPHKFNNTVKKINRSQEVVPLSAKFTYNIPQYDATFKNPCFYNHTGALYCLPYAFILGMPKCGTTDLFRMLVKHPRVEQTKKEPHWWTRGRFQNDRQYPLSLMTYLSYYKKVRQKILKYPDHIFVDASASTLWDMDYWSRYVNYTEHPSAEPSITTAHYIKQILPQARFIVILRNPVDRLYSDYLYFSKRVATSASDFAAKVQSCLEIMTECIAQHGARSCVYNHSFKQKVKVRLRIGMYHIFLEDWFKVFPRERFLILRLEEYHLERSKVLAKIGAFLDIGKYQQKTLNVIEEMPQQNSRRRKDSLKGGMLQETRSNLTKFYQPYNDQLAELLSDTRYRWL